MRSEIMYVLVALIVAFGLLGVAYMTQNKSEPMLETVEELSVEELSVIEIGEPEMTFQLTQKIEHGRPARNKFDEFEESLKEYNLSIIRDLNTSVKDFNIFAYDGELYHLPGENAKMKATIVINISDLDNTELIDATVEHIITKANEILGPDFIQIIIQLNDAKASSVQRLVTEYTYDRETHE